MEPPECPHCGTELIEKWVQVTGRWLLDEDGAAADVACPECGQDATTPPPSIRSGAPKTEPLTYSGYTPDIPAMELTLETYATLREQFDLEPPLYSAQRGVPEPLTDLPPSDSATWRLQDVSDTVTTVAEGKLPLQARVRSIDVRLDQAADGPVTLTVNGDSKIEFTSAAQLPTVVFDTIRVSREEWDDGQ